MLPLMAAYAINLAYHREVTPKMLSCDDAAPRWTGRSELSMIAPTSPAFPRDLNEWISDVLGKIFGWTSGATLGTLFTIAKRGEPVGTDEFGNRYYQSRDTTSYDGRQAIGVPVRFGRWSFSHDRRGRGCSVGGSSNV